MADADYRDLVAGQREYFHSGATRPVEWRCQQLEAMKPCSQTTAIASSPHSTQTSAATTPIRRGSQAITPMHQQGDLGSALRWASIWSWWWRSRCL